MPKEKTLGYTKVSYHDRGKGISQIRVIGKWLVDEGFRPGSHIQIKIVKKGQILLTNVSYL